MLTLPRLIDFFGERHPRERTFVASVARNIREAGLIETGKPGRGGRQANLHDAAMLMIALGSTQIALTAREATAKLALLIPAAPEAGEPDPLLDFLNATGAQPPDGLAGWLHALLEHLAREPLFVNPEKTASHYLARVRIHAVAKYYTQAELIFWTQTAKHIPGYKRPEKMSRETRVVFHGAGIAGNTDTLFRRELEDASATIDRQQIGTVTEYDSAFLDGVAKFILSDQGEGRA